MIKVLLLIRLIEKNMDSRARFLKKWSNGHVKNNERRGKHNIQLVCKSDCKIVLLLGLLVFHEELESVQCEQCGTLCTNATISSGTSLSSTAMIFYMSFILVQSTRMEKDDQKTL
jgi:hypothetical protein